MLRMIPMRCSILCLIMLVSVARGYSQQRQLKYEDRSDKFGVFVTEKSNEAGLVIICSEDIALTFASNRDQTVDVFKTEVKGSDKYYYLRLPTGKKYEGRKLTIYAPRYEQTVISMDLVSRELKTLYLYDPDVMLLGCYNQTMKESLEIFRMAQYPDAKAKYRLAAECSDAPATVLDDIQQKIDIIDTIIRRRQVADESFRLGNFNKAYTNYQAAFAHNPGDRYVELRIEESRMRLGMATGKKGKSERRKQKVFALSYETTTMSTIGLSFGWYRAGKVGMYFAAHIANNSLKNESNASLGLTFRLFNFSSGKPSGAWLSTGGGYSSIYAMDSYDSYNDDIGDAVTPEAGLLFKFGWFVLKYRFQYHFYLTDNSDSYYGYRSPVTLPTTNHLVGIGICF